MKKLIVSDVAIGVALGIGAPCLTVCVVAVLIYCHKNRHRFRLSHYTGTQQQRMHLKYRSACILYVVLCRLFIEHLLKIRMGINYVLRS